MGEARRVVVSLAAAIGVLACGCGDDASATDGSASSASASSSTTTTGSTSTAGMTTSSTGSSSSGSGSSEGPKLDVALGHDIGDPSAKCKVMGDMDAVGTCRESAMPDSFDPDVQWEFLAPQGFESSIATPLVVNLTDDNDDGNIDLCDIPDVIVVAGPAIGDTSESRLYVLDGATGTPHFFADDVVQFAATPAVGDIDGDGLPEIVAVGPEGDRRLRAFEHDGTLKWINNSNWISAQSSALALGDVDNDGDVEILGGTNLWDHEGNLLWSRSGDTIYSAAVMADIDDDDELEILTGPAAFNANGNFVWLNSALAAQSNYQHPHVANFDDDPEPEILVAANVGLHLLEADGTAVYVDRKPGPDLSDWNRPLNIHDLDGDGVAEFGASAPSQYGVFESDAQTVVWVADIADPSGQAGGTAFDFLGAGIAQTVYADEHDLFVFDETGVELLSTPRISGTVLEYPVVADIDNDGSAEILIVANDLFGGNLDFTIKAVRDQQDRWIQARRIWNQHTYHVTNVREDGTIPQYEPKHWELLNTFRTQAQIEGGAICRPEG